MISGIYIAHSLLCQFPTHNSFHPFHILKKNVGDTDVRSRSPKARRQTLHDVVWECEYNSPDVQEDAIVTAIWVSIVWGRYYGMVSGNTTREVAMFIQNKESGYLQLNAQKATKCPTALPKFETSRHDHRVSQLRQTTEKFITGIRNVFSYLKYCLALRYCFPHISFLKTVSRPCLSCRRLPKLQPLCYFPGLCNNPIHSHFPPS